MEPLIAWLRQAGSKLGNPEITPETDLIDQGVLDSLEILRLVAFLEERFRITIPVEDSCPRTSGPRQRSRPWLLAWTELRGRPHRDTESSWRGNMGIPAQTDILVIGGGPAGTCAA